jgi:hypothetical protein
MEKFGFNAIAIGQKLFHLLTIFKSDLNTKNPLILDKEPQQYV